MTKTKPRVREVKGWAYLNSRGVLEMEKFYTRDPLKGKATFAIFKRTQRHQDKEPSPNPTWGYEINGGRFVKCKISYTI